MRSFGHKNSPIILFSSIDWEITLREFLFSIFIFGTLMLIGFFISNGIKSHIHNKTLVYRQSAQIKNNPTEFKWAIETDVGNVFVEGKLKSVDSVTHEKLGLDVLSYNATYQHYTMHTRPVTRTRVDSKGRSHTYTTIETYWSWDTYKRNSKGVKEVEFSDVKFNRSRFDLGAFIRTKVVGNGHNDRIVFKYIPCELYGAFFGEIKDKTFTRTVILHGSTIEKLYEDFTTSHLNMIFWIVWIILSVLITFIFYIHENNWLEH